MVDVDVECPMCGGNNNHLRRATIETGNDEYEITDRLIISVDGHKLKSEQEQTNRSKSELRIRSELSITMHFECEDGHQWNRNYCHHKGSIFKKDKEVVSVPLEKVVLAATRKCDVCGNENLVIAETAFKNGATHLEARCMKCDRHCGFLPRSIEDWRMPVGKHKGALLADIPKDYLAWCSKNFRDRKLKGRIDEFLHGSNS